MGQHSKVHEMPVIGATVIGGILTHRRNHDAVDEFEIRQAERREQGTGHEIDRTRLGTLDLALDGFQVGDNGTNIVGIKTKFRHIWVAGHDALSERFFQGLDRIEFTERAERRRRFVRALAVSAHGMARRAATREQLFAAF